MNETTIQEVGGGIDLIRILMAMLKKLWLIVLSVILCGGIAFGYTYYYIEPLYQTTAQFYVNNRSVDLGGAQVDITSGDISTSNSLHATYSAILKTRTVLEAVIERGNLTYSYDQLYDMISSSSISSTAIFTVTVTSKNAEETASIANIITEVLPEKAAQIVEGSSMAILEYAVIPGGPFSPSITRNTMLGMIVGILLSCGAIALVTILDNRIHSEDEIAETHEVPLLAVIPYIGKNKSSNAYGYGYANSQVTQKSK